MAADDLKAVLTDRPGMAGPVGLNGLNGSGGSGGLTAGRRDRVVHVRFSLSETAAIEHAANAAGVTVSAFMRSLTLEGAGVRPFLTDDDCAVLDMLLADMRAIGVNLNQLVRTLNRRGQAHAHIQAHTSGQGQGRMADAGHRGDAGLPMAFDDLQRLVAAVILELRSYAARGARRHGGGA